MAKRRKKRNPDGGIDLDREDTTLADYANVARRHPAVRGVFFDGSVVEVDMNNGKWMLIAHPEALGGDYGSPVRTPSWVPDPEYWFGLWIMPVDGEARGSTLYNTPERLRNKLDVESDRLSNPRDKKKSNPLRKDIWAIGHGDPENLPHDTDEWWHDGEGYEVGYTLDGTDAFVTVVGPDDDEGLMVKVGTGDHLFDRREVMSEFDRDVKLFATAYRYLPDHYQEALDGIDRKRAEKIWDAIQNAAAARDRPATYSGEELARDIEVVVQDLLDDRSVAYPTNPDRSKRMMNPHNY